jgi:hypothetical protein
MTACAPFDGPSELVVTEAGLLKVWIAPGQVARTPDNDVYTAPGDELAVEPGEDLPAKPYPAQRSGRRSPRCVGCGLGPPGAPSLS